ncbi:MAG: hypothetical protein KA186_12650, partial [Flavobacteriales bacterium]|nr:hypothetical protein [Flavobacteriales bacterium]
PLHSGQWHKPIRSRLPIADRRLASMGGTSNGRTTSRKSGWNSFGHACFFKNAGSPKTEDPAAV